VTGRDNQIRRKGHLAFMRVLNRFAELGGQPVIRKTIHPKRRKIKRLMEINSPKKYPVVSRSSGAARENRTCISPKKKAFQAERSAFGWRNCASVSKNKFTRSRY